MKRRRKRGGWTKREIDIAISKMTEATKCPCPVCRFAASLSCAFLQNNRGEVLAFFASEIAPQQ